MIKSIYEKWEEIENNCSDSNGGTVYAYYLSKMAHNKLYFGISDIKTKKVFIEFETKVIENYKLPEILGLKIKRAKATFIDENKAYIVVENEKESDEVFLAFISTLVDNIYNSKSDSQTIEQFEKTIKYYKEFFSNPNKSLSNNEEQGLCGELLYLRDLIINNGENCVNNWLGPNKNKRDFVFDKKAVEVKSTLNQTETSITISNENQLDSKGLEQLSLAVYILEKDPNGILNVTSCANEILKILTNVQYIKVFKSKLLQLGIDINQYKNRNSYTCQSIKIYNIDENFPCLRKNNIPSVVFNVSYKINLNSLDKYLLKEE